MQGQIIQAVIRGTPGEAGGQAIEKLILPLLSNFKGRSHVELQQFYIGMVGTLMGSLAAQVGKEQAHWLMSKMTETLASMPEPPQADANQVSKGSGAENGA